MVGSYCLKNETYANIALSSENIPLPCIDIAFSASKGAVLFVDLSHYGINEEHNKV
jgi:hypothetical protein